MLLWLCGFKAASVYVCVLAGETMYNNKLRHGNHLSDSHVPHWHLVWSISVRNSVLKWMQGFPFFSFKAVSLRDSVTNVLFMDFSNQQSRNKELWPSNVLRFTVWCSFQWMVGSSGMFHWLILTCCSSCKNDILADDNMQCPNRRSRYVVMRSG